jgi:peptidoglycan/LPS O-acetylase OafA/YrhL
VNTLLTKNQSYRNDIDGLKAIAIIAVVLYHMGFAAYGYLGVDIFLVVSGYLFMNSLMKRNTKNFSYFRELCYRLLRLYPLVLIACAFCLVLGFFTMLPDDYENLSQSVVATNLSANNILSYITTGNYWEVVNELKPLMHTWYLGILVQFYIVFLLLYKVIVTAVKAEKRTVAVLIMLTVTTVLSMGAYLLPTFNSNLKFYMLPFRFFELSLGCLAAYIHFKRPHKTGGGKSLQAALPILATVLFLPLNFIPDTVRLLVVVGCAVCAVLCTNHSKLYRLIASCKIVTTVGKASFSIYIWHQILLAFTRYTVTAKFTVLSTAIFFAVVAAVSAFSYFCVEKQLGSLLKKQFVSSIVIIVIFTVLISGAAGVIYLRAGVVRDVPELDITTENVTRGMHAQYNHRIWQYENKPFEDNGKINVLIVGNSYARDCANVILESEFGKLVNISYSYSWNEDLIPIIKEATFVFSQGLTKENVPDYLWNNINNPKNVYGIGTKRFGENNGIVYSQRSKPDYLYMTVSVPESIISLNNELQLSWGNNYINFIEIVQNADGTVPVFTPEGKFISQDCWHLTKAGAVMYADIINWGPIFGNSN